jgi:hypothetical protein
MKAKRYMIPFDKRKLANLYYVVVSVIVMDMIVSHFMLSDFRLPVPFLGAVAAMMMLLYQVSNIQWCTIKCMYSYVYNKL